ncbi:protein-disulfide reductase DsbD domain-containing protein [Nitratireductor sp. GISD-1A_MAKvit]|uniref:protein-disulfide reductase DsbD domain-containing protein n=1 Tax=Nitratireductor sp. GISD-1A_MAKvit TaxID=3234198 RepID=UPI0034658F7E
MFRIILSLLALMAPFPAFSASSQWAKSEGGAVRLVTTGLPDKHGRLRGALEIRLEPGWKTYWRNPGPAGIPPQLDLSRSPGIEAVEVEFPPPRRIRDGDIQWAGYTQSVSLPVTFTFENAETVTLIDADVFLGICKTICIPFQASFLIDPGAGASNAADALVVQRAFDRLPGPANDELGLVGIRREQSRLVLTATLPEGARNPVLFLDHQRSHLLATPQLTGRGGAHATFAVEISGRADGKLETTQLLYTLTVEGKAVHGTIRIP